MSQNIWKAKYTKRYYLRPKSVGHFCTQPEGQCRTRKGPGTTAQQVPCFGDTPLHRWPRATPEGPSVAVPVLGLLALLHPDLSVSLCQHGILQQQGINLSPAVLNPSSLLLLLLLLALLHQELWGHSPI